jgi:hypothetical protein
MENISQRNSNHVGILTCVSIEVASRGAQWAFGSALETETLGSALGTVVEANFVGDGQVSAFSRLFEIKSLL